MRIQSAFGVLPLRQVHAQEQDAQLPSHQETTGNCTSSTSLAKGENVMYCMWVTWWRKRGPRVQQ